MAEKSDEEIIKELGLEASSNDVSPEEALVELSIKDDEESLEPIENQEDTTDKEEISKENVIENEDRDDEKELVNESNKNNEEPLPVQKKQPKIYKILIAIVIFLFIVLTAGTIMYFTGFFDPEPVKQAEKVVEKKTEIKIDFKDKNIDESKLNKKLKMLTKHEIMNKEELEAEEKRIKEEEKKKKEAERKKKEAEEKALNEKKKKEEERLAKIEEEKKLLTQQQEALKKEQKALLILQEELKAEFEEEKKRFLEDIENQKTEIQDPVKEETIEESQEVEEDQFNKNEFENENKSINQFLPFINVATIKGNLYKSYLDKILEIDKNVSLCRDFKNRIEIYSGPYDSETERQKVINKLLEKGIKEAYLVDFTAEEYEKRCKY